MIDTIGYIYVIDAGERVKVGASKSPVERISNLCNTLGLHNPKFHISKKCINHFNFESHVHSLLDGRSATGEFFTNSFDGTVKIIDSVVIEAKESEVIEIKKQEAEQEKQCLEFTKKMSGIDSINKLIKSNKEKADHAYSAMLKDAIEWSNNLEKDYTDELIKCNGSLPRLLFVSLQIRDNFIDDVISELNESRKLTDAQTDTIMNLVERVNELRGE